MRFDYKYALINSSWLIPLAILSFIGNFVSSTQTLIWCAAVLAVLYFVFYIKVQVPLRKKDHKLLKENRKRQQPLGYILLFVMVLVLIASEIFNDNTWFWPMLLVLSLIDDGFSTPTKQQ